MSLFVGRDGRLHAVWRLLAQYAAFRVAALLLVNLAVSAYALVLFAARPAAGGLASALGTPAVAVVAYAATAGAALLSVWLAGRLLDRRPFKDFGLRLGPGWWLDLSFGLALGALLMAGVFATQLALGWVSVGTALAPPTEAVSFLGGLVSPIVLFLAVGFYEELVFRGYQLRNGAEGLATLGIGPRASVLAALALSSVFFGLLHAANPNATFFSTLNIVLAGFMLGVGYALTGQLAIPIGLHVAWNFFQGCVFGFPVSGTDAPGSTFLQIRQSGPDPWTGGPFGPEGGLLGTFAILAGVALVILWVYLRRGDSAVDGTLSRGPQSTAEA